MLKSLKKPWVVVSAIVIWGAMFAGNFYLNQDQAPVYDVVVATKSDIDLEVSVTGRVKPLERLDLAFERGGKVSQIYVELGEMVSPGQNLVSIEDADLKAQVAQAAAAVTSAQAGLKQYQAILEAQRAKLSELTKGTRSEEIQLARISVDNATQAIVDAEKDLVNTRSKATLDLENLYDEISDVLNDALVKADDALYKQIDELFSSDDAVFPELTFPVADPKLKYAVESQRRTASQEFGLFKAEVNGLPTDQADLDTELLRASDHLRVIRDFLAALSEAVNFSVGLPPTTLNTYKTSVNAARVNVSAALTAINNRRQAIAAQRAVNQQSLTLSENKINGVRSSLASAEAELSLKKAGFTSEQISAQAAQVRQAEANVSVQHAQIQQAQANFQNLQVQLSKAVLKSPLSGIVALQNAKLGEMVSPAVRILSLISQGKFEIEANVPEADIAKVKIGNRASVTLDAYGSEVVFEAKATAIDPIETIIEGVPTYQVTFQFLESNPLIKSGMTANIDVASDRRENVVVIPQRALIKNEDGKWVRILRENGRPEDVSVKTGLRGSDGNVEILSGVHEGDKIVLSSEE